MEKPVSLSHKYTYMHTYIYALSQQQLYVYTARKYQVFRTLSAIFLTKFLTKIEITKVVNPDLI